MHLNDTLYDQVQELSSQSRSLLLEGRTAEALALVRKLLSLDSDDINVCIVSSAQLIDAAARLQDVSLAEQGMKIIEKARKSLPGEMEETDIQFVYNLANGYSVKYRHYRDEGRTEEAHESLQEEKHLLQSILIRKDHIPDDLLPAVYANYANTLDHLNRTFEAIDHYLDCLSIAPDHGLAKGNCGNTIERVVFFSDQHRLSNLQASWDFSSEAIANPSSILRWADAQAVKYLKKSNKRLRSTIENRLAHGLDTLEEFRNHRSSDHTLEPCPSWVDQSRRDRLLLTFNQLPLDSAHEALEDLFFDSLVYGLSEEDKERSIELIHLFNAIKEEFVTARYLYYLAENHDAQLAAHNDFTLYGDPEGDAEFGLIAGLLKASFRASIDLLDKIAVFLALYLELEVPAKHVNFNNVWFEKGGSRERSLHPKILKVMKDNYPLIGLRDLQRDFFRQEYPGPIKDVRNAAVHRWLRLSWLPMEESYDGASWNVDDFAGLTFFVLRQAKAAIMSLAAAVNVEERRRQVARSKTGKTVQTPLRVRKPISSRAADEIED